MCVLHACEAVVTTRYGRQSCLLWLLYEEMYGFSVLVCTRKIGMMERAVPYEKPIPVVDFVFFVGSVINLFDEYMPFKKCGLRSTHKTDMILFDKLFLVRWSLIRGSRQNRAWLISRQI